MLPGDKGEPALSHLRVIVAVAGSIYLAWWFCVEALLPGSFNPLLGRLLVVALDALLLGASLRSRWVDEHEQIFEAFTQLEPLHRKHIPGLGLGLAW